MSKGHEVVLDALKSHSKDVRTVGEAVGTCADAAEQDMEGLVKAFGLIGQIFGGVIAEGFVVAAGHFIHQAQSSADDMSDRLDQAHKTYQSCEESNKAMFEKQRKELEHG